MEGDGLLVDTGAIATWMAEMPLPIGRPARDDADAARIARGEALYAERCASCHAGPLHADGRSHDVLADSPDPAAAMDAVDTPSLRAVRLRAPYLHDGRAPTLRAVMIDHNDGDGHGRTSDLDDAQIDALVAFLETL